MLTIIRSCSLSALKNSQAANLISAFVGCLLCDRSCSARLKKTADCSSIALPKVETYGLSEWNQQ